MPLTTNAKPAQTNEYASEDFDKANRKHPPPRDNWKKKKDEFERFHLASFAATLLGFALKLPRRKGKTLVTENSVNVHIFESLP